METDFHHTVTYITARLAGFGREDAGTIARSAQYVDDAAATTPTQATADSLRPCLTGLVGHPVALLFHMVPGNGGRPAGEDPPGGFIAKTVCVADSPPVRDMIDGAIADGNRPEGLYRLGLALHVYSDTWAHQGYAAVRDPVNDVSDRREIGNCGVFPEGLEAAYDRLKKVPHISYGHRLTSVFPDIPFLSWRYVNGAGAVVECDNPTRFCDAADHMYRVMRRFLSAGGPAGLGEDQRRIIRGLFTGLRTLDKVPRHQRWLEAVRDDAFGFGAEALSYDMDDVDETLYEKAVDAHTAHMVEEVLPRYGLRVSTERRK